MREALGVAEFKPLELVEKAVLRKLQRGRQPKKLLDWLSQVIVPALTEKDLLFDWRDPIRKELAERCHVPLCNSRTLPARYVYAGSEWTGNELLERAYGSHPERGFLHPPPAEANDWERWEKLYRWLGVGWCPKVLPIVCEADEPGTRQGPEWSNDVFSVQLPPDDWGDYCATLDEDFENRRRMTRLRQNWTLDNSRGVLPIDGAFKVIAENWDYYEKYQDAVFYRSNNMKSDDDN